MPLTVLFDLDETLLNTNMDQFLPGYFELLSQALSHIGSHDMIIQQITHAVGKMIANQDPGKTLKEVFAQNFYPQLETTEKACQSILESFYRDEYPKLKPITNTNPEASELVKWCQSKGMIMAIATNPLFPQTATRQRIEWAGLDPEDFFLFTSYDDFHFTKPHLAYYAEVLGRLGWPEGPLVMIGDNLSDDLFPMDTFGAETFWINHRQSHATWEGGTLSDVKPWLQQMMSFNGTHFSMHPDVILAILRSTPAVIDTWLRVISNELNRKIRTPQEDQIEKMLTSLTYLEEKVYLPLWGQIKTCLSLKLSNLENLLIHHTDRDDYLHPQDAFNHFLKARLASLKQIGEIIQAKQYEQDGHLRQSMINFWGWMAENDREILHHAMNL